jgi:EAL domain-containing protein (putative c-di-GMP-specific phosphodiesterase class I)
MELKVIAEGVETEEQLEFLRFRRCDEIQSYLFSRPVAAEAFTKLLQEGWNLYGGSRQDKIKHERKLLET